MSNLDNSNNNIHNDNTTITTAASADTNHAADSSGQHLPIRKRMAPAVLKWQPVETPAEQAHHAADSKPITSTTFITSISATTPIDTTTSATTTYTTPLTTYPLLPQYPTSSIDSDGGGDTTETDEEKQFKLEGNSFRDNFNVINSTPPPPPPNTTMNSNKRMKESTSQGSKPAKKLKRGRPPLLKNQHQPTTPFSAESSPLMLTAATGLQQNAKPTASDNTVLYCICKRPYSPDAPRFMIACDKCNEWFHGECIEIDEKQSEFIDLYYCDNCSKLTGKKTSWKPKCANPACSRPARIGTNQGHLSKYCTDNCGMQVARARIEMAEIKKRNALRASSSTTTDGPDLSTSTLTHPSPSASSDININSSAGIAVPTTSSSISSISNEEQLYQQQQLYNPLSRLKLSSFADLDDRARLMRVKDEKAHARYVVQLVDKKSKFLNMVLQHHQKGICGFDSRLNWSDSTWEKIHDVTVEKEEDESLDGGGSGEGVGHNCRYIFKDEQSRPIYTNKAFHICQQTKKCNKHADWQKIKSAELEQDRSEQFVILTMLERERQQIKARMKKRREEVDLVEYLENGTITHFK